MGEGEKATQAPPALDRLCQQEQPTRSGEGGRGVSGSTSRSKRADRDLGPHQGADACGFGGAVETGGAIDAVAIGQCEGRVLECRRRQDEIFRIATGFEKGEGASGAQLYVVLGSGHV